MDGCPYSIYEDGRDVKDYMIPPKGYRFKGFRFDPDASNQIYDGRLIAEYEKEPFNDILKSNLWKFILALVIIAVITVVVILAVNVFNKPKCTNGCNYSCFLYFLQQVWRKFNKPKQQICILSSTKFIILSSDITFSNFISYLYLKNKQPIKN